MKLFLRLAWRNIWRHRLRTLSIVLTISLTMTLMFFIDGLYNGMLQDLDINTIKLNGSNIQIYAADFVSTSDTPLLPVPNDQAVVQTAESLPQVISASRRIETSGLASNKEGAFPVSITGIEPEVEQAVSSIAQRISAGRHLTSDDLDNVYIGKSLAEEMQIGVGDRFTLAGQSTHKQIRSRSMTVVGIYDVGLAIHRKKHGVHVAAGSSGLIRSYRTILRGDRFAGKDFAAEGRFEGAAGGTAGLHDHGLEDQ